MTGTKTAARSKLATRRIWPARVSNGVDPSVAEELTNHPHVINAFAAADMIMSKARAQATQKIAEGFASAVRDRHNQSLRTTRQM